MASQWADLADDSDDAAHNACAWADNGNSDDPVSSHATGWAGHPLEPKDTSSKWASLDVDGADEENDDEPSAHVALPSSDVVDCMSVSAAIANISGKSTLHELKHDVNQVTLLSHRATTAIEIGSLVKLYDQILQTCADHGSSDRFLDETFADLRIRTFVE